MVKISWRFWPRFIGLVLGCSLILNAEELKLSASVNRTVATDRDQLLFTVTVEGTEDFPEIPPPESPDFVIIAGPSMSSSIQIINGRYSATKQVTWQIAPTRTGNLTIPALKIKHRGKVYTTEPITITITTSSTRPTPAQPSRPSTPTTNQANREVILKAVVSKTTLYKGEELDVTYELYYRNLRNIQLRKLPNAQGFWLEQFPDNPNPTITTAILDGIQYRKAVIKEIALFPNTTGVLTIDPLVIDCEVILPTQRRRSIFDDFFSDDFFNDPFFGGGSVQKISVQAEPVKVNVKPLPKEGQPLNFTGAVGNFQLTSSIDTTVVQQNQAVTLRYSLSGTGNCNTLQLPQLQFPANLEVFDPKIDKQISNQSRPIRGTITWEYVMIPRRPGIITLPALAFSYFDPQTGGYRTLTSRSFSIKVNPSADITYRQGESWQKEEVALLGQDIRYLMRPSSRFYPLRSSVFSSWWFWLCNTITILLLISVGVRSWWLSKVSSDQAFMRRFTAQTRAHQRLKKLQSELSQGQSEQYPSRLYNLLTGFIADRLNLPPAGIGVSEVTKALDEKKVPATLIETVRNYLLRLDEIRFLPTPPTELKPEDLLVEAKGLLSQLSKEI